MQGGAIAVTRRGLWGPQWNFFFLFCRLKSSRSLSGGTDYSTFTSPIPLSSRPSPFLLLLAPFLFFSLSFLFPFFLLSSLGYHVLWGPRPVTWDQSFPAHTRHCCDARRSSDANWEYRITLVTSVQFTCFLYSCYLEDS